MLLGSDILETVIALFSIFFLCSVVASQINEGVAALLSQRARQLEQGIVELICDPRASKVELEFVNQFLQNPLFSTLQSNRVIRVPIVQPIQNLLNNIFKKNTTGNSNRVRFPSYLSADIFARALLSQIYLAYKQQQTANVVQLANASPLNSFFSSGNQVAKGATQQSADNFEVYQLPEDVATLREVILAAPIPTHLKQTLLTLINRNVTNMQTAVKVVEEWYNQKMDRVSGAYKRWVQQMILIWSLLIVLFLNLDTLNILNALSNNEAVRQKVTAVQALATATPGGTVSNNNNEIQSIQNNINQLENLGLPIGPDSWGTFWNKSNKSLWDWLVKLVGLLVSVEAVSLGAPFWFDVLNKIVNLRSSGNLLNQTLPLTPPAQTVVTTVNATTPQTNHTNTVTSATAVFQPELPVVPSEPAFNPNLPPPAPPTVSNPSPQPPNFPTTNRSPNLQAGDTPTQQIPNIGRPDKP